MENLIFLIHPIFQFLGILLAAYAFFLGTNRIRSLHFNQNIAFKWKQHVFLGKIVSLIFIGGMMGGVFIVYLSWHGLFMTKVHSRIGLLVVFITIFGLTSGLYMDHFKKKRTLLPLIHGLSNLVALILAASQVWTGFIIYSIYVLGN